MPFGCFTCCLLPARLALVVAAYSEDDSDLIALAGKYLSPVAFGPCVDGLPDLVRQSCFVQFAKLCCDLALAMTLTFTYIWITATLYAAIAFRCCLCITHAYWLFSTFTCHYDL